MVAVIGVTIGLVSQVCINMEKHDYTGNSCCLLFHLLSHQIDISDLSRSKKRPDYQLLLVGCKQGLVQTIYLYLLTSLIH